MTPRHKIDVFKRQVQGIKDSEAFNQQEKFTYFLGLRSACKILAGETAGVTKFMDLVVQKESDV